MPPHPLGMAPTFWLYSILLACRWEKPLEQLLTKGIQTRPLWTALHLMPPYKEAALLGSGKISEGLCAHGLSLPCSTNMTEMDQAAVIQAVLNLNLS